MKNTDIKVYNYILNKYKYYDSLNKIFSKVFLNSFYIKKYCI